MPSALVLYSDQIPPHTDAIDQALIAMLPANPRIGYIPSSPDPDRIWFKEREFYYARYGATLEFFGLETEFRPERTPDLLSCDAIHLTGGNTFQFLYWLRERNLMDKLKSYTGALIGVSAGAILMTPTVETSSICGDVPYPPLKDQTGLGLVDFAVVPHVTSQEPITELAKTYPGKVIGLPDGSGIVVRDSKLEIFGPIFTAND